MQTQCVHTSTAVAQLLGRFFMIIPIMAIAGNLAQENGARIRGNVPRNRCVVSTLLVSTIVIVGALNVFPCTESPGQSSSTC